MHIALLFCFPQEALKPSPNPAISPKMLDLGLREKVWAHVNYHLQNDLEEETNDKVLRRFVHLANNVGRKKLAENNDSELMHKVYVQACQVREWSLT